MEIIQSVLLGYLGVLVGIIATLIMIVFQLGMLSGFFDIFLNMDMFDIEQLISKNLFTKIVTVIIMFILVISSLFVGILVSYYIIF